MTDPGPDTELNALAAATDPPLVEVVILPTVQAAAVDVLGYLQARVADGALDDVVIASHDGHELRTGALWALVLGDLDEDDVVQASIEDDDAGPVELGVMGDWIAAGHHNPEGCQATAGEPGNCGELLEAEVHDPPSCGCGGHHWTCLAPDVDPAPTTAVANVPADAEERRADRLTWSPGDLQISPPPQTGKQP